MKFGKFFKRFINTTWVLTYPLLDSVAIILPCAARKYTSISALASSDGIVARSIAASARDWRWFATSKCHMNLVIFVDIANISLTAVAAKATSGGSASSSAASAKDAQLVISYGICILRGQGGGGRQGQKGGGTEGQGRCPVLRLLRVFFCFAIFVLPFYFWSASAVLFSAGQLP